MKKKTILLFVLAAVMILGSVPVWAHGGNGKNANQVCWEPGSGEVWANFVTTGSGIVQQFRYSPDQKHLIFKPADKFPRPEGDGWFWWTYTSQYDECVPASDVSLDDVFDLGSEWWVLIVDQG